MCDLSFTQMVSKLAPMYKAYCGYDPTGYLEWTFLTDHVASLCKQQVEGDILKPVPTHMGEDGDARPTMQAVVDLIGKHKGSQQSRALPPAFDKELISLSSMISNIMGGVSPDFQEMATLPPLHAKTLKAREVFCASR